MWTHSKRPPSPTVKPTEKAHCEWVLLRQSSGPLTFFCPICVLDSLPIEGKRWSPWYYKVSPCSNTLWPLILCAFHRDKSTCLHCKGKAHYPSHLYSFTCSPLRFICSPMDPVEPTPSPRHSQLLHWVWEAWPFPFFLFCFLSSSRIFLSAPWQGKTNTDNARYVIRACTNTVHT